MPSAATQNEVSDGSLLIKSVITPFTFMNDPLSANFVTTGGFLNPRHGTSDEDILGGRNRRQETHSATRITMARRQRSDRGEYVAVLRKSGDNSTCLEIEKTGLTIDTARQPRPVMAVVFSTSSSHRKAAARSMVIESDASARLDTPCRTERSSLCAMAELCRQTWR